jgi:hypothetical protein
MVKTNEIKEIKKYNTTKPNRNRAIYHTLRTVARSHQYIVKCIPLINMYTNALFVTLESALL